MATAGIGIRYHPRAGRKFHATRISRDFLGEGNEFEDLGPGAD
jgi:hypothetical protein